MSRAVTPEGTFNKERFSELLTKVKGNLTFQELHVATDVSVSLLCRYLKKQYDVPPTPSTIKKIAKYSEKINISEESLLEAAGYSIEKHSDAAKRMIYRENVQRSGFAAITGALTKTDFKWSVQSSDDDTFSDYKVEIKDEACIKNWYFCFIIARPEQHFIMNAFSYIMSNIVTNDIPPHSKITIITNSESLYDFLSYKRPYMLAAYYSIMLFDPEKITIEKEKYIQSYIEIPDELKTRFTFDKGD